MSCFSAILFFCALVSSAVADVLLPNGFDQSKPQNYYINVTSDGSISFPVTDYNNNAPGTLYDVQFVKLPIRFIIGGHDPYFVSRKVTFRFYQGSTSYSVFVPAVDPQSLQMVECPDNIEPGAFPWYERYYYRVGNVAIYGNGAKISNSGKLVHFPLRDLAVTVEGCRGPAGPYRPLIPGIFLNAFPGQNHTDRDVQRTLFNTSLDKSQCSSKIAGNLYVYIDLGNVGASPLASVYTSLCFPPINDQIPPDPDPSPTPEPTPEPDPTPFPSPTPVPSPSPSVSPQPTPPGDPIPDPNGNPWPDSPGGGGNGVGTITHPDGGVSTLDLEGDWLTAGQLVEALGKFGPWMADEVADELDRRAGPGPGEGGTGGDIESSDLNDLTDSLKSGVDEVSGKVDSLRSAGSFFGSLYSSMVVSIPSLGETGLNVMSLSFPGGKTLRIDLGPFEPFRVACRAILVLMVFLLFARICIERASGGGGN